MSLSTCSSSAFRVEAAVVGAGVLGLATARALAATGRETIIIEREKLIGSGTSSRNSEVIHAGIYYEPTSTKAKLCVRGREQMYQYCSERGIDHKKIGKLIVATNPSQLEVNLPAIMKRAEASGATDLQLLTPDDVTMLEPEVVCEGALLSPSTGVVDSHGFMVSLLGDAESDGATLALQSQVEDAKFIAGKESGILLRAGGMDLLCGIVVNCAGLFADKISSMIMKSKANQNVCPPRQFFAKGNYYKLEGQRGPFSHLVYPVPEEGGLGVHATIDLGGSTRFGPDVEWIDPSVTDPDTIDLAVDPTRADSFYGEVRKYWPGLLDFALVADYAGIRPKVYHPADPEGMNVKGDFVIQGPKDHGVPGFVNMLGMESPGLTSSLAVADLVVEILKNE